MSQLNRYEFVGSFLRPERLKEARKNYELNYLLDKFNIMHNNVQYFSSRQR